MRQVAQNGGIPAGQNLAGGESKDTVTWDQHCKRISWEDGGVMSSRAPDWPVGCLATAWGRQRVVAVKA